MTNRRVGEDLGYDPDEPSVSFKLQLPRAMRERISDLTDNVAAWIRETIQERLDRE